MAACGPARAAGQAEARDYESVVKDMEIMEWGRAEEAAAKFIAKYPAAENYSKVVLFEAQAQYKQGKCGELVELLTTNQSRAGAQGDQFNYWLGQGYFCGSDYHLAAETFARLVRNYPASSLR